MTLKYGTLFFEESEFRIEGEEEYEPNSLGPEPDDRNSLGPYPERLRSETGYGYSESDAAGRRRNRKGGL